jgi:aconitase B
MAGKYAGVIDKLPRVLSTTPDYQQRVNAVKAELLPVYQHASAWARQYAELRASKKEAEEVVSGINLQIEAVSQLLIDQYEAEGFTKLTLADGSSVRVQIEPYAQVKDKEAFRLWCIANGYERSMALPWQSTNSIVKEALLAGNPEPTGVEAVAHTKVMMMKG